MGVKIRKKDDGYYLVINYKGKRKSKKVGDSKALAMDLKKKAEARLAIKGLDSRTLVDLVRRANNEREMPTLKKYAEAWLKEVAPASRKQNTLDGYRNLLENHVYPAMGTRYLDEITPRMINDLIHEKLRDGLKSRTVKNLKHALSAVLQNAMVPDEFLVRNPARGVTVPRPDTEQTKEIDPFTIAERATLESAFLEHYPEFYSLVAVGFRTGLRIGELLGLQWGDIDWTKGTLRVRRNVSRLRVGSPKTRKHRTVPLSAQTLEILQGHKKHVAESTLKHGWRRPPEWIFFGDTGEPVNYFNWIERVWKKAMEKSGLRHRSPHAMRHSYVTQRLQAGHPIAVVARDAGHGVDVCFKTYFHFLPADDTASVDALDDDKTRPRRALKEKRV